MFALARFCPCYGGLFAKNTLQVEFLMTVAQVFVSLSSVLLIGNIVVSLV